MGLIRAAVGAAGSTLSDQWLEYFYCDSIPADVLAVKGRKKNSSAGGNDNIISNGSVIAVADGQCMMIVEQGRVVEFSSDPGEFTYDSSTEPSVFASGLNAASIREMIGVMAERFKFGGEAPKDQRVYYFNTKEIMGNKYGTMNPIPFRVVDRNIGLDIDVSLRCFGEYSYRIQNPVLFYSNVCGNIAQAYTRDQIEGQMRTELLSAMQPVLARLSEQGIRYSAVPGHTTEMCDLLNEQLSDKWRDLRGIEIVSFGVSSIKASDEDEAMIKELQRNAAFRDPNMAAAHLVGAQAQAMQSAASNQNAGPAMAFMGMNMANQAGGANIQNLYNMGQQQAGQAASAETTQKSGWTCSCGAVNTGKFCSECGMKQPVPTQTAGWTCSCGAINQGKFCSECGQKKPADALQYKCDKCGWVPEDPAHPPKFCPECGDPFGDEDIQG